MDSLLTLTEEQFRKLDFTFGRCYKSERGFSGDYYGN
jgi:hypothetical protein